MKDRVYSGTKSQEASKREIENRMVARQAAGDGIVLLKNDGVLPLKAGEKIALFGGGAVCTVKGGTGSGDVNERESVSVYRGFAEAGLRFSNREWLDSFAKIYQKARQDWRSLILQEMEALKKGLFEVYSAHSFHMPAGLPMKENDFEDVETGFYAISRTAGENADRFAQPGDYYLSLEEKEQLLYMSAHCKNVAVILNTGGQMDLQQLLAIPNLKVLINMMQPGMEGGHALADLITGKVTPSGKLTDTWAANYEDYPNSSTFSHNNGNTQKEFYEEGIYIGYRYFDSFEKKVAYPFGFGQSYTSFKIVTNSVTVKKGANKQIEVSATVTNTGDKFAGKEVVQVYVSCPQRGLAKETKRLCGFAKTKLLQTGESQQLNIDFDAKSMASFDEKQCAWVLEKGLYGVWVGNSSVDIELTGVIKIENQLVLEKVEHICPLQETLKELQCSDEIRFRQERSWQALAIEKGLQEILFDPVQKQEQRVGINKTVGKAVEQASKKAAELVEQLTDEQLISMAIGKARNGQGQLIGAMGMKVPGAGGETSGILEQEYKVPGISVADGPAGLRLAKSYEVDLESDTVYDQGFAAALEGGFFADQQDHPSAVRYYQYCTAMPVGTLLAQTWDLELMKEVGKAVGREMQEFGIALWLAPGMNIHRNPLCGRNFEYYSEDPLVSGRMAAAITKGVQSIPGVGTTIKHMACNNQEDNRLGSDSIVSERTLREIYLRGFEIAVKESQPMAIMSSYNLVNGIHAANNWDLCTQVTRNEWDFQGIIMTDWNTTSPQGGSIAWKCIEAGNDLIMPGLPGNSENLRQALAEGSLSRQDLKDCVRRILTCVFQTLAFEGVEGYGKQFE